MAYYLRVFCASREPVTVSEVMEAAATDGLSLRPDSAATSDTSVALVYAAQRPPLFLEIERNPGAVQEEVAEFVRAVEKLGPSDARERVLAHLQATNMVAAVQILTSDADDATYNAAGSLVRYFAENRDGLIQADDEGFYDGAVLILPAD